MQRTKTGLFLLNTFLIPALVALTVQAQSNNISSSPPAALPSTMSNSHPVGLNEAFDRAAKDFDVPRDLLVAIAFVETRFNDRNGKPSKDNGYGLMHLVENPQAQTLVTAARSIDKPTNTLKSDVEQNIRGGAAILRAYANEQGLDASTRKDLAEWYQVVARYSNAGSDEVAKLYADEVFGVLSGGLNVATKQGETISIVAREVQPKKGKYADVVMTRSLDLPATRDLNPVIRIASPNNFSAANRVKDFPIRYIVIHTTQGSYASAINWFQNPAAHVSAHYVVRSSDGNIAQVVLQKDVAWHAGNRTYNEQGIGIEHEGFIDDASWYTDAMYKSSAALTRSLCLKFHIPMDRAHIIGHYEIKPQRNKHTDPGPLWNWKKYMKYVNPGSQGVRPKGRQPVRHSHPSSLIPHPSS